MLQKNGYALFFEFVGCETLFDVRPADGIAQIFKIYRYRGHTDPAYSYKMNPKFLIEYFLQNFSDLKIIYSKKGKKRQFNKNITLLNKLFSKNYCKLIKNVVI